MEKHRDDLETTIGRVVERELGARVERIEPLSPGLGSRRFARVWTSAGATLIARVEEPEDPGGRPTGSPAEPPLEPVRALLEQHRLPVPARYGADALAGVELLEDVGSVSLRDAALPASPEERHTLYEKACALIPRLQRVTDPAGEVACFRRRLDGALIDYKAELFSEWSLSQHGRPASPAARATVRHAFGWVAEAVRAAPERLSHRDLQSSNLFVREVPAHGEQLVMIDLQGAFLAPPEYDLVCLLRDSYVELDSAEIAQLAEGVRPELPDAPDVESFAQRFDLLTLVRKGKDHARFLSAARTRGDQRFLGFVPATVRYLRAAVQRVAERDPRFRPLADLIGDLPETACAG